jgi:putative hemolysin
VIDFRDFKKEKKIDPHAEGEDFMHITRNTMAMVGLLLLGGALLGSAAQTAKAKGKGNEKGGVDPAVSAQAAYCTGTGGAVETRVPTYGTNNSSADWLRLAGKQYFCRYTASDQSHIHLNLETLFTPQPSLAALAYYAETPWNGQGNGSPASFYCTQLGGTDLFGGATAAGGGWVELNTVDEVLDACIFPDNSTIDSWGLFYHSDGIIRGIDLSTVLKYPNPYPAGKKGD